MLLIGSAQTVGSHFPSLIPIRCGMNISRMFPRSTLIGVDHLIINEMKDPK